MARGATVLGLLVGALALASPAHADCPSAGLPFLPGQDARYVVSVGSLSCTTPFFAGGRATIRSLQVIQAPRHGRLILNGRASATYVPDGPRAKPDRFVLALTGASEAGAGVSRVTFDVAPR